MKICYFGIFKEDFTRSRVISAALESCGFDVVLCVDRTPSYKKYLNLIRKHRSLRNNYDIMIVGFPGYFVMFLARLLTTKPIIFDAYISYYDGLLDRRNYWRFHPHLLFARVVDYLAVKCSTLTLTINGQYKKFFVDKLNAPTPKMEVLHKGADESIFYPRESSVFVTKEKYIVVWWGSFIPLHGLDYIIDAATDLSDRSDVEFHIIGTGQIFLRIKEKIKDLGLKNVVLLGRLPAEDLIAEISMADVALGLFNNTPKALRCVTNKVYEAMAMGKAIITEDSLSSREVLTHGENVYLVPPGNSTAIASAISLLVHDNQLRQKIAVGARKLFEDRFTYRMIGLEFVDIIKRHGLYY